MTIKELREENNLSQEELAQELGCSAKSISQYETGKRKPSEGIVKKIMEIYGIVVEAAASSAKVVATKAVAAKETTSKAAMTAAKAATKKIAEAADVVAKETEKAVGKAEEKAAQKKRKVIIQSPMGGELTPDEILAKVGDVDRVYVRVDENKAYWIRGEESGSVELW